MQLDTPKMTVTVAKRLTRNLNNGLCPHHTIYVSMYNWPETSMTIGWCPQPTSYVSSYNSPATSITVSVLTIQFMLAFITRRKPQ